MSYTTLDGTGKAGINYQAVSGTLLFSSGNATNTIIVPINNNQLVTGDLNFTVALTNVTAPGGLLSPRTQTVVIAESNAGINYSQASYSVLKTGVAATINVYRTGFTDSVVSVDYMTANGTAIGGINFFPTSGTLVFASGVTNQAFSVPIIAAAGTQPDRTVLLNLSNVINGILLPPVAARLTIHDNTGSYVVPAGSQLLSEANAGAPNGIIDPNETVTVLFALRDAGGNNVSNLIATLLATNGVTPVSYATTNYGLLAYGGHSVSRAFTFVASGTNTQPIAATFNLYDGSTNIGTAVFGYTLGSWSAVFANSNAIVINDFTNASPYPAVINVSGVGGALVKATVTLNKLTHPSPHDVDVLVVSPTQLSTLIMAHTGGGNAVTNIVLTFDDAATNSLSQFGQITTSTNKPTQNYPVKNFP